MISSGFELPDNETLLEWIRICSGIEGKGLTDAKIHACIQDAASAVIDALELKAIIRVETIISKRDDSICGKSISIKSANISRMVSLMSDKVTMYVFALTLGVEFDRLLKTRMEKSLAEALFIDAAGSFITEYFAGQLENFAESGTGKQRLCLSDRFSPGYCDWDLRAGQFEIMNFLDLSEIGVKMLSSSMMEPLKTITGIIFASDIMPQKNPCSFCNRKKCGYRRY